MKRRIFSIVLISAVFFCTDAFAAAPVISEAEDIRNGEINNLVASIDSVTAPYVKNNYVIFTAQNNARHVGIAFDFENFRTIHSFQLRKVHDAEYGVKDSFYFYILELPKTVQTVEYRLVVDGLWTTDPLNKNVVYNEKSGLRLSRIDATREIPPVTEQVKDNSVHFVYRGASGQQIRLAGSFTNWDSWIYELTEVAPGLYQFDLPLPPGKYEYAFYNGMKSIVDKTNPNRCYTQDGREANYIIVK